MRSRRRSPIAGLLASALVGVVAAPIAAQPLTSAQSDYVEHCAGCHGIQGLSAPAKVPQLKARVGYFLCTRDSRDYLVRLPNVAHSATSDDQLADILNFVAFDLGRTGQTSAPRYTAEEVGRLRRAPLTAGDLVATRRRLVRQMIGACQAPASLLDYNDRPNERQAGASRR